METLSNRDTRRSPAGWETILWLAVATILFTCAWSSAAVEAQVYLGGRHTLDLSFTSANGDVPEPALAESTGLTLDQEVNLRAYGTSGGWNLEASLDSRLPAAERFHLSASQAGTRLAAGSVDLPQGESPLPWARRVLGLRADYVGEWGEVSGTVGTPLGIPVDFAFRGDGGKGPYHLGASPAVPSSASLLLDGEPLEEGIDFTLDADVADVLFFEPVPVTSVVSGTYQIEAGGVRRAYGMEGAWNTGPWQVGFAGAGERTIGADASAQSAAYPMEQKSTGWWLGRDGVWSWTLGSTRTRNQGVDGVRTADGWYSHGRYAPSGGKWSLAGTAAVKEPGYQPVGAGSVPGSGEVSTEAVIDLAPFRSTTTLSKKEWREQGEEVPVERVSLSQSFGKGWGELGLEGGRLTRGAFSAREGGLSLHTTGEVWDVRADIDAREFAAGIDETGRPVRRSEFHVTRYMSKGVLTTTWIDELAPVDGSAERRSTRRAVWKTQPGADRTWRVTVLSTGRQGGDGTDGRKYLAIRRRLAPSAGYPLSWSAAWDRREKGKTEANLTDVVSADLDHQGGAGLLALSAAYVARSSDNTHAWTGSAEVTGSGRRRPQLQIAAYAPSSVRTRVRLAASPLVTQTYTTRTTLTFGDLAAFPLAAELAEGDVIEADPGSKVEVEVDRRFLPWRATAGIATLWRTGVRSTLPLLERRLTAALERKVAELVDAKVEWRRVTGYYEGAVLSHATVETEWKGMLSWWWTDKSKVSLALTRTRYADFRKASAGDSMSASLAVETLF